MALVLCTGTDRALMQTRQMMLEQAGHQVVSVTNEKDLVAACKEHRFDVAVVGQGMSAQAKRRVAGMVRQNCPGARVLELFNSSPGRMLADADDWLSVPGELPQELPERVAALAQPKDGGKRERKASR